MVSDNRKKIKEFREDLLKAAPIIYSIICLAAYCIAYFLIVIPNFSQVFDMLGPNFKKTHYYILLQLQKLEERHVAGILDDAVNGWFGRWVCRHINIRALLYRHFVYFNKTNLPHNITFYFIRMLVNVSGDVGYHLIAYDQINDTLVDYTGIFLLNVTKCVDVTEIIKCIAILKDRNYIIRCYDIYDREYNVSNPKENKTISEIMEKIRELCKK